MNSVQAIKSHEWNPSLSHNTYRPGHAEVVFFNRICMFSDPNHLRMQPVAVCWHRIDHVTNIQLVMFDNVF